RPQPPPRPVRHRCRRWSPARPPAPWHRPRLRRRRGGRSRCASTRCCQTASRRPPPPSACAGTWTAGGSRSEPLRHNGGPPQRSSAMQYPEWIWHNGGIKPWAEANTHVMSHGLHYGSSVFEGIRAYRTPGGGAIFRLQDHIRRLFASARIYDMVIPYTLEELTAACHEVVHRNALEQAYLRPVAWRGLGGFGLSAETPIDVAVASWHMGPYLGEGALTEGIDACVSSWQRFAPNTIPAGAKAGGNYRSGQLVARGARRLGFGEGIALASTGLLSEGAGENLFLVFDGVLHTPPVSAALLNGITRDSIIQLAKDAGIAVVERDLPREYLYLCDELFMCGTAAGITPIRSVDGRQVGAGRAGPVTLRLQELFFGLFEGRTPDTRGWLEPLAS